MESCFAMAKKFLDKYRIESMRLQNWDYSRNGYYFITLCTKNRAHAFGEIRNGKLIENEQMKICRACWFDLPNHYPNCILDEFIIMPDHIHAIIQINNGKLNSGDKKHPLSEIIRAFKTFTARKINEYQNTAGKTFWQRDYYEHIIRDKNALNRIREYIRNNPKGSI
jgi:putative transposase